jgi:ammonium transporter Rh
VYWPSFVGATETGNPVNESHCVVNTILALLASTTMTFYLSQKLHHGKFDPVHIANSTLAGGVAIGSAGRLPIGPGGAILTGSLAGVASVYGYCRLRKHVQDSDDDDDPKKYKKNTKFQTTN